MAKFDTSFGDGQFYSGIRTIKETYIDPKIPVAWLSPFTKPEESTRQPFHVTSKNTPTVNARFSFRTFSPQTPKPSTSTPVSITISRDTIPTETVFGDDIIYLQIIRYTPFEVVQETGYSVKFSKNEPNGTQKTFADFTIPTGGTVYFRLSQDGKSLPVNYFGNMPTITFAETNTDKSGTDDGSGSSVDEYIEPWELYGTMPTSSSPSSAAIFDFSWSKSRVFTNEEVILTIRRTVYSQLANGIDEIAHQPLHVPGGTKGTDIMLLNQETANNTGPNQPWTYKTDLAINIPSFLVFGPNEDVKTIKMKFSSLGTAYFDLKPAYYPHDGSRYRRTNPGLFVWYPASVYSFDTTAGQIGGSVVNVTAKTYNVTVTRTNPNTEEVRYVRRLSGMTPLFDYSNGAGSVNSGNFIPLRFYVGETSKTFAVRYSATGTASLQIVETL